MLVDHAHPGSADRASDRTGVLEPLLTGDHREAGRLRSGVQLDDAFRAEPIDEGALQLRIAGSPEVHERLERRETRAVAHGLRQVQDAIHHRRNQHQPGDCVRIDRVEHPALVEPRKHDEAVAGHQSAHRIGEWRGVGERAGHELDGLARDEFGDTLLRIDGRRRCRQHDLRMPRAPARGRSLPARGGRIR